MSSSLNAVIDINCFCLANSSSFCFRFFSKARRALSLGSSKSSLITMDSTKCLPRGGFCFNILRNMFPDLYLKWSGTSAALHFFWFFPLFMVHGWFISDVRVLVLVLPKFISINDNSDQFYKRVVYKFLTRKVLRQLHVLWSNYFQTHKP